MQKNVILHWKSSKFSLAMQPEALIKLSRLLDIFSSDSVDSDQPAYSESDPHRLPKCCFIKAKVLLIEPQHEISNDVVRATSKASDQPAHTRSLIRAFASRLYIL